MRPSAGSSVRRHGHAKPFLVEMAKAETELGYRPAVSWRHTASAGQWLIAATRGRDWREDLARGANSLRFDYEAEDAFSRPDHEPRTEARSAGSSPMRRVTPSASKRSSGSCDVFREVPSRWRKRPSVTRSAPRARRPAIRAPARTRRTDRVPIADADSGRVLEEAASSRLSTFTGSSPSLASSSLASCSRPPSVPRHPAEDFAPRRSSQAARRPPAPDRPSAPGCPGRENRPRPGATADSRGARQAMPLSTAVIRSRPASARGGAPRPVRCAGSARDPHGAAARIDDLSATDVVPARNTTRRPRAATTGASRRSSANHATRTTRANIVAVP